MTTPVQVPEKKKRRTHHWKAIAKAAERLAAERLTMLDTAHLRIECIQHAADMAAVEQVKRLDFWRLVALWLALFAGLTLAALARVVL